MSKALDALILIGVAVAAIMLLMMIVLNLGLFLALLLAVVLTILILVVALVVAGLILSVPFYFLKQGPRQEPGAYHIEQLRSIKEDEKK